MIDQPTSPQQSCRFSPQSFKAVAKHQSLDQAAVERILLCRKFLRIRVVLSYAASYRIFLKGVVVMFPGPTFALGIWALHILHGAHVAAGARIAEFTDKISIASVILFPINTHPNIIIKADSPIMNITGILGIIMFASIGGTVPIRHIGTISADTLGKHLAP